MGFFFLQLFLNVIALSLSFTRPILRLGQLHYYFCFSVVVVFFFFLFIKMQKRTKSYNQNNNNIEKEEICSRKKQHENRIIYIYICIERECLVCLYRVSERFKKKNIYILFNAIPSLISFLFCCCCVANNLIE